MSESAATPITVTHPTIELFELIGSGASATIHAAHDLKFDRPVAVKQLRPDAGPAAAEAFKEEARFLSGLSHPNIVHVYDFDERRGWMVMELMAGGLDQELARGPLPADKVRSILRQLLQCLEYLHGRNKLHGEIKPGNILIDDAGTAKLCDTAGVDVDGEFRRPDGSQRHVAPEVLNPEEFGSPGPGVDLYCLGLVALELLAGPKFTGFFKGVRKNPAGEALAWAQWHASPSEVLPPVQRLLRGVPADLAAVLDRLLQKRVCDRYASASAALADLPETAAAAVERAAPASAAEPAESIQASGTVQVARPPIFRRHGKAREKTVPTDPLATWNAKVQTLPFLKNPAWKRRVLLAAGAGFGLVLCLLTAGAPKAAPLASVRFLTVDEDGASVETTISIDGEPRGRSDEPLAVAPGSYQITATPRAGALLEPATATFELTQDSTPRMVLKRRTPPAPPPKDMAIVISPRSELPSADPLEPVLWIDELRCPNGQQEFRLRPGEHQLRVQLEGHATHEETILVSEAHTKFTPTLKRLQRHVTLLVEPANAEVFFAGQRLAGASPYEIARPDGDYRVYATCPEHESAEEVLSIRGDDTHQIALRRTPSHAVRFETVPDGATLYVDGKLLGPTPNRYSLPAGRHEAVLQKPGFAPVKSCVTVDASSDFFFWYLEPVLVRNVD